MNKNIPTLRFPQFHEEWQQFRIKDVIEKISTGLNPRNNFVLNNGGKNYYVTIKNFKHGILYLDDKCDKIDNQALEIINKRSDLKVNDILFASIGRIGDCFLIKKEPNNWNINESIFVLKPNQNKIKSDFLFYIITSKKNQISNEVTGSTFKSIKINVLKNFKIYIPSLSLSLSLKFRTR